MSADSPIIKKELREYVDILGYSESELLKKNREETKKLGPISIMQVAQHKALSCQYCANAVNLRIVWKWVYSRVTAHCV